MSIWTRFPLDRHFLDGCPIAIQSEWIRRIANYRKLFNSQMPSLEKKVSEFILTLLCFSVKSIVGSTEGHEQFPRWSLIIRQKYFQSVLFPWDPPGFLVEGKVRYDYLTTRKKKQHQFQIGTARHTSHSGIKTYTPYSTSLAVHGVLAFSCGFRESVSLHRKNHALDMPESGFTAWWQMYSVN